MDTIPIALGFLAMTALTCGVIALATMIVDTWERTKRIEAMLQPVLPEESRMEGKG